MKKTILKSGLLGLAAIALSVILAGHAFAMQPTLTLSSYVQTTTSVQISVTGDPNSAVNLEYQGNYGFQNEGTIGYTNSAGYFSMNLNPNSYLIPTGSEVFVTVDGQQSQYVPWPTLSNSNYTYTYPTTNYNYTYPTTYPYQNNYQNQASIPLNLSSTTTTLSAGQSQSIQIYGTTNNYNSYQYPYTNNTYNSYSYNYGNGTYYISINQNQNIATASVIGNTLNIYGISQGSTNVTVCQSISANSSIPSCGTVLVTVTTPYGYYNNYSYGNYYNSNSYPYDYNYSYPYDNESCENLSCPLH